MSWMQQRSIKLLFFQKLFWICVTSLQKKCIKGEKKKMWTNSKDFLIFLMFVTYKWQLTLKQLIYKSRQSEQNKLDNKILRKIFVSPESQHGGSAYWWKWCNWLQVWREISSWFCHRFYRLFSFVQAKNCLKKNCTVLTSPTDSLKSAFEA